MADNNGKKEISRSLDKYRSMQAKPVEGSANKEMQLLYGSSDRYGIYQLKDNPELDSFRFVGTDSLVKRGIAKDNLDVIVPENYDLVYVGELSDIQGDTQHEKLGNVFLKFNLFSDEFAYPEDFKGHSLSVSDIVVLHENGKNSAHFVDSFGFAELPDFMPELENGKEQDILGQNDQKVRAEMPQNESADALGQKADYPAVYRHTLDYADDHGELDEYRASRRLNMECRRAVDDAIRQNYDGELLHKEAVKPVVEEYGSERLAFVLANTIQELPWDGRFSRDNKTWAAGLHIPKDMVHGRDRNIELIVSSHPAVLDIFINIFRREVLEREKMVDITSREEMQEAEIDTVQKLELEDISNGDEIIDLGDETEQVLADMKKYLEDSGDTLGNRDQKQAEQEKMEEKVEEANRIETEILQGNIVEKFKEKTYEFFHEICEMNPSEIEDTVKCHVQAKIDDYAIAATVVDSAISGSRCRGLERNGSDLDVVVELSTNEREDDLFNAFNNEDGMYIGDVRVDITPITPQQTGTLESYLPQVEEYLAGVREAREQEPKSIFYTKMYDEQRFYENTSGLDAEALCKAYAECDKPFVEMRQYGKRISEADYACIQQGDKLSFSLEFDADRDEITISDGEHFETKGLTETLFPQKTEPETVVTLTVAECSEFHNFGEFHGNIATADEAIAKWKRIPPERINGIPAIGINIHTPGTESYEDVATDILTGNRFELDVLDYYPEIKGNPQAIEVIAELMAKLPDMKIEGDISEELEAKIWEKRMPDLAPAEQLAVEIDRFIYYHDTDTYHSNNQNMGRSVSEISALLYQGDIGHLSEWLNEVISVESVLEETQRAKELLDKLAGYKLLAEIEDNAINGMGEQNYNMVDNVSDNGAGEKKQKEKKEKAQDKPAEKMSLKARLSEKKVQVSGQGRDDNTQNQQRGVRL